MQTDARKRQDIMDLGYHVVIPWSRLQKGRRVPLDAYDEMSYWCDDHCGVEGFAWTSVHDYETERTEYWFVCWEFAFEFKMKFA